MYFCPVCSNLLIPEQGQAVNLSCTTCPYIYKLCVTLSHSVKNNVKILDKIMGEDDDLKYANKCQAKCPKCDHNEAMFIEIQTRSADEPMTIFYQCTKCKFDWKE